MDTAKPRPPKATRGKRAKVDGAGAIAQGRKATAVGERGVNIKGDNSGPINTGDTYVYGDLIQQAQRPGAGAAELSQAYLAWLSLRANELPLLAGDSGAQVQLSSVYTALLTDAQESSEPGRPGERALPDGKGRHLSALEALDQSQYLVLMGGPGSGKTTFLNFVTLCMAGELLGHAKVNLVLLRTPLPPDPDQDEKTPKPQRWSHKALLPVRVTLRDFAASLPPGGAAVGADALWQFIVGQLPSQLAGYAEPLQTELLARGGLVLLDGLDEVPDALHRREQVKQAVQEFAGIYGKCRFLVTSRTYAYQRQDWKLNGFAERELRPFSRGQIERFVDAWYAHMVQLFRLTAGDAQARAELLKRATQREDLRELAERPLLLTLMARLQTKGGGSLPENREELYAQSVAMLLDEWEGLKIRRDDDGNKIVAEPSLSEWLNASRENIRRELDKLAYQAHQDQPTLVGTADIRQADLIAALMAASRGNADTRYARLEEYLRDRAGLLNSHGEGLCQFPHRSFQEYLAACHLARFDYPDTLCRLVKGDPNRWREVALLAAARHKGGPSAIWELVEELCAKDEAPGNAAPEAPLDAQWGALLAGQVLAETGLAAPDPDLQERHERKRLRVRDWQLHVLGGSALPARERALAGILLAKMGDPRDYLLDVDPMRFCAVPRGPFWMGDEGDKDAPLHLNDSLDYDYWIAQSPVTVAQFAQFARASAHPLADSGNLNRPANWPVTEVTWHDAQHFCIWLTERWRARLPAGWQIVLPSEAEWEKAARGGLRIPAQVQLAPAGPACATMSCELQANPQPQRIYPWGDDFEAGRLNADMNIGSPSTVACFATGRSPYQCEDMAGNVWEWTRSLWGTDLEKPEFVYPYAPADSKREDVTASDEVWRVVRGGSKYSLRGGTRCACRSWGLPSGRVGDIGFRVVLRSAPVS